MAWTEDIYPHIQLYDPYAFQVSVNFAVQSLLWLFDCQLKLFILATTNLLFFEISCHLSQVLCYKTITYSISEEWCF